MATAATRTDSGGWDSDYWREALLFAVLTLLSLGIVMALSIDGPKLGLFGALYAKATRLLPGLVALFVLIRVPIERLRKVILPCFWLSVGLCLLPLILSDETKGAVRWIRVFGVSV